MRQLQLIQLTRDDMICAELPSQCALCETSCVYSYLDISIPNYYYPWLVKPQDTIRNKTTRAANITIFLLISDRLVPLFGKGISSFLPLFSDHRYCGPISYKSVQLVLPPFSRPACQPFSHRLYNYYMFSWQGPVSTYLCCIAIAMQSLRKTTKVYNRNNFEVFSWSYPDLFELVTFATNP